MKIKCNAIIACGGTGSRMNTKEKKQFLKLLDIPIFIHTIKNISKSEYIEKIVVVCHNDDIKETKRLISEYGLTKVSAVVAGGKTRAESVKAGLLETEKCDIVLIHDAVRPFIRQELLNNCIADAVKYQGAVLGIPVTDTTVVSDSSGNIEKSLDRKKLSAMQTPQCFQYDIITKAYENYDDTLTDDAAQVIKNGGTVHITRGDDINIKITTPKDMLLADNIIKGFED